MKISTRLMLAALVPILMAGGMITGLLGSYHATEALQAQQTDAIAVSLSLNELNDLARSYMLEHDERPRRQFMAKHAEVLDFIEDIETADRRSELLKESITEDTQLVGVLFTQIVDNWEQRQSAESPLAERSQERLSAQLFIRARSANAAAATLARLSGDRMLIYHERINTLFGLTALLMAFVLTIVLFGVMRGISASLAVLQNGTKRISRGELDHRIKLKGNDELAQLARSFDVMTADLAKVTVSRAELRAEVEHRRQAQAEAAKELENTQLLLEASMALSEVSSVPVLLDRLVRLLSEATRHGRVLAMLWNERERRMELAATAGRSSNHASLPADSVEMWPAVDLMYEGREGVLIDFDAAEPGLYPGAEVMALRLGYLATIAYGDQFVGVLLVDDPAKRANFTESETELIRGIASQAAIGVVNARALNDEAERARLAESLNRIDRRIHATLDRNEMLKTVAEESASAIEAQSTALVLRERGQWVVRYLYNMPDDLIGLVLSDEEAPLAQIAAETGRPVAVENAYDDLRANPATQRKIGVRAVMVAPVIVQGQPVAAMYFNYPSPRRFSEEETRYAARLASSVSLAIANVRLYESERNTANQLQEALLSMPDTVEGIDFTCAYRAASDHERVGGDFYDVFEVDEDRIGLTIGDVAGKGLSAATLTSLAKNTVRAHASEPGKEPARILSLANQVLLAQTSVESFVTLLFGILDLKAGRLLYANGGHTTGAIVGRDGTVRGLPANGPIVGAFATTDYLQAEIDIAADDMIFLYTDGLTEARDQTGELYGEQRLFELLSTIPCASTRAAVDRAMHEVLVFSNGELRDDVAILAVRPQPSSS